MEQDVMKKVMDEVMKRFASEIPVEAPKPAVEAACVPPGVTEFIGTARGHTIGLVIANVKPRLHEKMGID